MMRLLLDTHSFLWFASGNDRLSPKAKEAVADAGNAAYLSTASLWEMAIKINIGKLKLPQPLGVLIPEQVSENEFEVLYSEVTHSEVTHSETYTDLPLHHRDPFDRMMIAQAKVEDLLVVSKDEVFEHYDIELLW